MKSILKKTVPVIFSFILPAVVLLMALTACLNPFAINEDEQGGFGKGAFTIIIGNSNTNAGNSRAVGYPPTSDDDFANLKYVVYFKSLEDRSVQSFQASGKREFRGYIKKGEYTVTMKIFDLSESEKLFARGVAEFNPVEITDGENSIHIIAFDVNRPEPPVITEQPRGAAYNVGAEAEALTVAVDKPGDGGNLSFQWYWKEDNYNFGGEPIPGATSASYTPTGTNTGPLYYYVVVTNSVSGKLSSTPIPSRPARVFVGDFAEPPEITTQPKNTAVTIGREVTLTVDARVNDGGALSFQWCSMKTAEGEYSLIRGATSRKYTPPTDTEGTFYYFCIVTNFNAKIPEEEGKVATTWSNTVKVEVSVLVNAAEPTITIEPQGGVYNQYTAILTIDAVVTDGGVLSYQWYKALQSGVEGTALTSPADINAGSKENLFKPNTSDGGDYYYYCVVTNTINDNGDSGNKTNTAKSETVTITINDGSSAHPFSVRNVTDLRRVGKPVADTAYVNWSLDKCYRQTTIIDLTNAGDWTPIGSQASPFTGSYDGGGFTINNLKIDSSNAQYQGLFGYISGAEAIVQNVGLENCNIKAKDHVGGVAGTNDGTVKDCFVMGSVSGEDCVGGVVGMNSGLVVNGLTGTDAIVINCYVTGTVTGGRNAGGVVGVNSGDSGIPGVTGTATIENCHTTSEVSGTQYISGVVGSNRKGTVINCYSTGEVSGNSYVGGVVGENLGNSMVINCYATGKVSGNSTFSGNGSFVGGLVGYSLNSTVENCYATGDVFGFGETVGGVVGFLGGNTVSQVKNCYATGNISGNTGAGSVGVGGVVGRVQTNPEGGSTVVIQNCVALNQKITTKNTNSARRVVSSSGGTLINNYGRDNMTQFITSNSSTSTNWSNKGLDNGDGKDISSTEWSNASWWLNEDNWSKADGGSAWDFETVWEWNSSTNLPILRMPN